jgi:hypothetical protein
MCLAEKPQNDRTSGAVTPNQLLERTLDLAISIGQMLFRSDNQSEDAAAISHD